MTTTSSLVQAKKVADFAIKFQDDVTKYFVEQFGEAHFAKLCKQICVPPMLSTIRVNTMQTTMQDAQQYLAKKWEKFDVNIHPIIPNCLNVAVQGPFDIELQSKFIVVDRKCGEAVLRGAHVFAPGILAFSKSVHVNDAVTIVADIEGSTPKGSRLESCSPEYVLVASGVMKMDHYHIFSKTFGKGLAVEVTNCMYQTCPMNDLPSDKFYVQNLPSMFVAHLLDPQPGERILDMCAAPGGKCSHAALLMQNQGEIIAFDKTQAKADQIMESCKAQNITIVKAQKMDSKKILEKKALEPESFDRVILDAPCSGLGLRPNFAHTMWTLPALREIAGTQKRLFREAAKLLKPGGVLVYSTCSFNPMEDEENVMWILNNYKDEFVLEDIPEPFKSSKLFSPGLLSVLKDEKLCSKVLRFDAVYNVESIGFFVAKFRKLANKT